MSDLDIGVVLPSVTAQREQGLDLRSAARHAEQVGLASVWHGDHLAIGSPVLDVAVGLATAAAVTDTILIGTGVYIPAIRPLALAAKQIASLQYLSGDRLILGVGSGGGQPQWAAAGASYAERGRLTDQALDLLPRLLTGERVLINGQQIVLELAVQPPPFWVGNASAVALRRAARIGDGWFPSLITPAGLRSGCARLAELADKTPIVAVGTTGALGHGVASQRDLEDSIAAHYGRSASGVPITGGPQEVADRLAEFRRAGAQHIVMGFADGDWRDQCDLLAQASLLLR